MTRAPARGPRYLQPQGCRWLYVPPVPAEWLDDATVPAVVVEGPKSALALLALAQRHGRRIVPIATGGCWGWRRTVDRERQPDGTLAGVTGPSRSLDWLTWPGRDAILALDGDARQPPVAAALRALARELAGRGAAVRVATVPATAGEKAGPDDVLEHCGDDAALAMLDAARPWAECAIAAAEAAIVALPAETAARKAADPLPAIEAIAAVDDPTGRAVLIARAKGLALTKSEVEARIRDLRAQADADRRQAAESARRGKLLGMRVDGAALLGDLAGWLRAYVVMSAPQADTCALWLVHGCALDAADYTPYLYVTAPEKRGGKSRLLGGAAGVPAAAERPAAACPVHGREHRACEMTGRPLCGLECPCRLCDGWRRGIAWAKRHPEVLRRIQ